MNCGFTPSYEESTNGTGSWDCGAGLGSPARGSDSWRVVEEREHGTKKREEVDGGFASQKACPSALFALFYQTGRGVAAVPPPWLTPRYE